MLKIINAVFIAFIALSPLVFLAYDRSASRWKHLILFASYCCFYLCLLAVPNWIPALKIAESSWNWSGKLFAIAGSLVFYLLFKKAFLQHNYLAFKLNDNGFKTGFFVVITLYAAAFAWALFSNGKSAEASELLWFQLILPGLDEELAFRGIMLGLLSNALKPILQLGKITLKNPALLTVSALFAFGHSFQIDDAWHFHQNWFEFLNMFVVGWILGRITLRSGSIWMGVFVHNLINVLPRIIFGMYTEIKMILVI